MIAQILDVMAHFMPMANDPRMFVTLLMHLFTITMSHEWVSCIFTYNLCGMIKSVQCISAVFVGTPPDC